MAQETTCISGPDVDQLFIGECAESGANQGVGSASAGAAGRRRRGRPLGYVAPEAIAALGQTTWKSALAGGGAILGDLSAMYLIIWLQIVVTPAMNVPFRGIVMLCAWIIVARAQRGLEVLTHEGSHFHLAPRRAVNDLIANFAAVPMAMNLKKYRAEHTRDHHAGFGDASDPDLQRYIEYDAEAIDRSSTKRLIQTMGARFWPYAKGWVVSAGTKPRELAGALLFHGALLAPLMAVYGGLRVLETWLVYWLVPYLTLLQIIRMIGESAEHIYTGGVSVFDSTVSNIGWIHRSLIHPHGDGYHLLHHVLPRVPHYLLRRAHESLVRMDPDGFGHGMVRTGLLQIPTRPSVRDLSS